jgi:hypothetical protein
MERFINGTTSLFLLTIIWILATGVQALHAPDASDFDGCALTGPVVKSISEDI